MMIIAENINASFTSHYDRPTYQLCTDDFCKPDSIFEICPTPSISIFQGRKTRFMLDVVLLKTIR